LALHGKFKHLISVF